MSWTIKTEIQPQNWNDLLTHRENTHEEFRYCAYRYRQHVGNRVGDACSSV